MSTGSFDAATVHATGLRQKLSVDVTAFHLLPYLRVRSVLRLRVAGRTANDACRRGAASRFVDITTQTFDGKQWLHLGGPRRYIRPSLRLVAVGIHHGGGGTSTTTSLSNAEAVALGDLLAWCGLAHVQASDARWLTELHFAEIIRRAGAQLESLVVGHDGLTPPDLTSLLRTATDVPRLTRLDVSRTPTWVSGIQGSSTIECLWCRVESSTAVASAIASLPNLRELVIGAAGEDEVRTILRTTAAGPNLTSLDLQSSNIRNAAAIATVPHFVQLTTLNLADTHVTDVGCLSKCAALRTLVLHGCESLTRVGGLQQIVTLTSLNLRCCEALATVTALADSVSLVDIDLSQTKVNTAGIAGLERIPTLVTLNLSYTRVADLSALAACPRLQTLLLEDCEKVKSIKGLENIATLTQLDLPGTNTTTVAALAASRALQVMTVPRVLTSLRGIETVATLREISLFDCESITSIAILARCTALTKICVEGTPLTDPGALAGFQALTHLQQLTLMFTDIADLSSIVGCISLKELTVSGSPQLKSISCLAHHASLARLSVRLCGLTSQSSIEGLQHIPALRELNLSDNAALNSVANLAAHLGLEELNISHTAVNDAGTAGLERIPTLRHFVAHGTKITSVRHLAASPSLTDISLHGSPVTDAGVVGLECLRTLVSLDLSETKVTKVDHLRNSTSLETLRLAFTGRRKKTPPLELVRHLMMSSDDDDADD